MSQKITQITIPNLDQQLKELFEQDKNKFYRLTKIDVVQVFICLQREKGLSLQQIGNKLNISRQAVSERCKKCEGDV